MVDFNRAFVLITFILALGPDHFYSNINVVGVSTNLPTMYSASYSAGRPIIVVVGCDPTTTILY